MRKLLVLLSLLLVSVFTVSAQIIHVPADQPTIQQAIMAAGDGNVVLVAEGTYYENINFMGKAITVASEYYLDHDTRHIRRTIIDGSRPVNPDLGTVVSFESGEDTNSVLCGFTITGGTGTLQVMSGFPPIRSGGGIRCNFSSARIAHNRIVHNSVGGAPWAFGGGFQSGPPFFPAYIVLEENLFANNSAIAELTARGGGISFASSGRIMDNTVEHNTAYSTSDAATGGGIDASSWDPSVAPPNVVLISGNVVTHNKALQGDEAEYWLGGIGGGLSIVLTEGVIINNTFEHNEVSAAHNSSSFAPGVLFDFPPDELLFKNNIVSHNTFSGAGLCYGGGFAVWDGNPTIENNLLEKNKATFGGGGWIGDAFSATRMVNNTIIKNHADSKGGAIYTKNATSTVMNSILWNNKAPEGPEIFVESGIINVSYSDIEGGWAGTANINANPNFIAQYSLLGKHSPCIDAGHAGAIYNDPQNPSAPGLAAFPARGHLRNDMGAYGGPSASGWLSFLSKGANEDDATASGSTVPREMEISNYPNPFNPTTTIQFDLPADGFVRLAIYNVLGQEVVTLVSEKLSAGSHSHVWNANDVASGVYIYRLQVDDAVRERKMILMK